MEAGVKLAGSSKIDPQQIQVSTSLFHHVNVRDTNNIMYCMTRRLLHVVFTTFWYQYQLLTTTTAVHTTTILVN